MRNYGGAPTVPIQTFSKPDLERLVAEANHGLIALGKLYNVRFAGLGIREITGESITGETRLSALTDRLGRVPSGWLNGNWKLEVAKKPAFEPFTVGTASWAVKFEDGELHIGCQKISDVTEFRRVLCRFTGGRTEQDGFHLQHETVYLNPGRHGLSATASGSTLGQVSWDEVEKIIKAIEGIE